MSSRIGADELIPMGGVMGVCKVEEDEDIEWVWVARNTGGV